MSSAAIISDCGRYRYRLSRTWNDGVGRVCFVMLNPSTADASKDDPTIRKCRGFAQRWGFQGLDVVNLFAWRATKPRDLTVADRAGSDIIGPENERYIRAAAQAAGQVVCAWGGSVPRRLSGRVARVRSWLPAEVWHIVPPGKNTEAKHGQPRHPLMQPYASSLITWRSLGPAS